MFSASVTRKKVARYPERFAQINREFLPDAALIVEGDAKLRVPVDSGRLRQSITHEVRDDEAIVGTNVEYAPYVEYGTKFTRAQPYLRPAIDRNRKKLVRLYRDILRRVFRGK